MPHRTDQTASARQRRYRQRERAGIVLLRVEVDGFRFIEALLDRGVLDDEASRDRRHLEAAAADILARWCNKKIVTRNARSVARGVIIPRP